MTKWLPTLKQKDPQLVLEALCRELPQSDDPFVWLSRWKHNETEKQQGRHYVQDYNVERNRILYELFDFLDKQEPSTIEKLAIQLGHADTQSEGSDEVGLDIGAQLALLREKMPQNAALTALQAEYDFHSAELKARKISGAFYHRKMAAIQDAIHEIKSGLSS